MTTDLVQFVCFETPLPRLMFVPVWTPVATSFLRDGLAQIALRHRIARGPGPEAPDFISRNRWPSDAFDRAAQAGRIGEGGHWPVRASQGGSYTVAEPADGERDDGAETVIALVPVEPPELSRIDRAERDRDLSVAVSALDLDHRIYRAATSRAPARFDLVIEVYAATGAGGDALTRLATVLAPLRASDTTRFGVYETALLLPEPAEAGRSTP